MPARRNFFDNRFRCPYHIDGFRYYKKRRSTQLKGGDPATLGDRLEVIHALYGALPNYRRVGFKLTENLDTRPIRKYPRKRDKAGR